MYNPNFQAKDWYVADGGSKLFKVNERFSEKGEKNATELIVREGGRLIYVWVTTRILERPII